MSEITFLGTAGGRMVVTSQLRKSGGMWLELNGKDILLDPGPGCLMRSVDLGFHPGKLDCIVLSHKHIDHSNDINIMIEAMSGGSFRPRGVLIVPRDALEGDDPVVLKYVRSYIRNNIKVLGPEFKWSLDGVQIEAATTMTHADVEAYGLKFMFSGKTLGTSRIPVLRRAARRAKAATA
jgi:ribonuclease BN (tRNA processing enzyme)